MDAVYVYRIPSSGNTDELRYSLRSLANVTDVGQVWIVGDRPDWLVNVRHIPTVQLGTKYQNSTDNIRAACEHPDMPDEFAWWNDDFFAMKPTSVEVFHRGPLDDVIDTYASRPDTTESPYTGGMINTRGQLMVRGFHHLLSYELHLPIPVHRFDLLHAIAVRETVPLAHTRTLYGNLFRIGGQRVGDVKVFSPRQYGWQSSPWLSTSDESFRHMAVGDFIRAKFPTPCRYEKAEAAAA